MITTSVQKAKSQGSTSSLAGEDPNPPFLYFIGLP